MSPHERPLERPTRSVALSFVLLGALSSGCGGRSLSASAERDAAGDATGVGAMDTQTSDAGADLADRIGLIDLSQAPATLGMTCGAGVGALAFEMPCLVGMNLGGQASPGWHVTECRMAQSGTPIVWSFILPLQTVARNPGTVIHFPGDVPSPPPAPGAIDLGGESARVSSVTGALTFSRVDPTGRAFIGVFSGTVVWKTTSGAETSCTLDGPFWGAPGGFL
jgi:hypothetical protein